MDPYRSETEKRNAGDESPILPSDTALAWVWLVTGIILILTDLGQPGPWGAWSSLGMLISGLAIVVLCGQYAAKWTDYKAKRQARH